ncbi:MAG: beta-ketoacyl synthase N-terminal-like domain-containing protein, partial [Phycisphaeraceae bacterium]|nr:beta-ketoacyl synthase N-terminal-like domain-containing protein [Phycisphaeraceae bacterium]
GAQGPSNTITCAEASGALSVGESLRVIQRDNADGCFCGGAESKLNPMAYFRQQLAERLTSENNDNPDRAVRPFCETATGTAIGEGGGILVIEALDTFQARNGESAYAEIVGFGASQSVHRQALNRKPDPEGKAITLAARRALDEADVDPTDVDLVVPNGMSQPDWDASEAQALKNIFGDHLADVAIAPTKSMVGNCMAGASGFDLCVAAKAVAEQTVPTVINCDTPRDGLPAINGASHERNIRHALVLGSGFGGQNAALLLRRMES